MSVFSLSNSVINMAPVGSVMAFAGNNIPPTYMICNGAELSVSDYPDLARVMNVQAPNKIRLPDLQERTIIGKGNSSYTNILGQYGSYAFTISDVNKMPPHTHDITLSQTTVQVTVDSGGAHNHTYNITGGGHGHGITDNSDGSLKIIKVGEAINGGETARDTFGFGEPNASLGHGGAHSHNIGSSTAGAHVHDSITSPKHDHTINIAQTGTNQSSLKPVTIIPAHVVVNYIIRVKPV